MAAMKALLIDAHNRTVNAIEDAGLSELQRLVGGPIEAAYQWPSGDVLYVDENGLFKTAQAFFRIAERPEQPFAGNGIVVGKEIGDSARTRPPKITPDALRSRVMWLTVDRR